MTSKPDSLVISPRFFRIRIAVSALDDAFRSLTEGFRRSHDGLFGFPKSAHPSAGRAGLSMLACCLVGVAAAAEVDDGVRHAIDRAADFLVHTQDRQGIWSSVSGHEIGETALAGMALLAAGKPAADPAVEAAARAVRQRLAGEPITYDTSLAIMFLDRLGQAEDSARLSQLGRQLAGGQCRDGSWSYQLDKSCGAGGDNSNTQFAALASWVSRRYQVQNDPVLQRLDHYFRTSFDESTGGWGYSPGSNATPTMTCAGLVGIAVPQGANGRAERPGGGVARRRAAAADPIARRALGALGVVLRNADQNPAAAVNSDLYFFWSLERVAVIYDVKEIGGVDWYRWGSRRLLQGQLPNGEWRGTSSSKNWPFEQAIGTSFGILFLSRANVAEDLTAAVGSGGGAGEPPPGQGGGTPIIGRPTDSDAPPPAAAPASSSKARVPRKQPRPQPTPDPGVLDPF